MDVSSLFKKVSCAGGHDGKKRAHFEISEQVKLLRRKIVFLSRSHDSFLEGATIFPASDKLSLINQEEVLLRIKNIFLCEQPLKQIFGF